MDDSARPPQPDHTDSPSPSAAPDPTAARFLAMHQAADPDVRARLRNELIEQHLPLVRALARRFANRGEPLDDLLSTATFALIRAVDRFDPSVGNKFNTFATPTILGELKRYFRDKSWAMKVPRRMQELNRAASNARDELTQRFGRVPSYDEIAAELNVTEEEVIEAIDSGRGYDLLSMDQLGSGADDGPHEGPGEEDRSLLNVVRRLEVQSAMEHILDEREQRIVRAYYFHDQSQTDIAQREGISQMHVSRLLSRALSKLRSYLQG